MARRTRLFTGGLVALAVLLWRCTLITGNFQECTADDQCPTGRICQEGYCILQTIPPGCLGIPDAGVQAVYGNADAGNAIHLGAALPITTSNATSTSLNAARLQHLNAMVLALEEINQREGVGGRPFALHVCDTRSDTNLLKAQVMWMTRPTGLGAPAIIVPVTGPVITAASITLPANVLLMSPSATSQEITELARTPDGGVPLIWRTAPSDAIQSRVISDLLTGASSFDAGLSSVGRVGIIYVNDPYGQGLNALISQNLPGKDAGSFQYTPNGSITSAVTQLNAFDPDLSILVASQQDAPRIVTAAAAQRNLARDGGHRWFFTDSAKTPALISESPPGEVEGDYGTAPAQGAGPAYALFRSSFQSRFGGEDPNNYAFIANHYDAMYAIALAAAYAAGNSGTGAITGRSLATGLTKLSSGTQYTLQPQNFTAARNVLQLGNSIDIEGASGHLNFDPTTGEAPAPIELWQVSGTTFRSVTVLEPRP